MAEVVGVGDKASVLTAPMAMLGAGRGNRDAEVAEAARTFPDPMTSVVVASAGEVVVGAPAADEPVVPPLTVRRMVKKARETSEVRAKVAVAGEARVVRKTTITTKRITEMKSTATMVRVSMAQSTTAKVEAKRRKKEGREDVMAPAPVPIQLQAPAESTAVAGETNMALDPENHLAQSQIMTRMGT